MPAPNIHLKPENRRPFSTRSSVHPAFQVSHRLCLLLLLALATSAQGSPLADSLMAAFPEVILTSAISGDAAPASWIGVQGQETSCLSTAVDSIAPSLMLGTTIGAAGYFAGMIIMGVIAVVIFVCLIILMVWRSRRREPTDFD